MAVVTAMANGTVPMCLLGSLLIYKEALTMLQIVGSIIVLCGILTLSLPTVFMKKDTAEITEGSDQALKMMLINSAIAMLLLSARMNMAKYCTRILSSLTFLKYNFVGDFTCAIFIIILSYFGVIRVPINSFLEW